MNQIGLVGRLTKDPALRQVGTDKVTVSFVLAINRNYRNNQGGIDADYLLCVAWGRLAERIAKYCGKGSLIGINGRLQSRSYIGRDNKKVYTTEVVVEDVRFFALKQREEHLAVDTVAQLMEQEEVLEEHFQVLNEDEALEDEMPVEEVVTEKQFADVES